MSQGRCACQIRYINLIVAIAWYLTLFHFSWNVYFSTKLHIISFTISLQLTIFALVLNLQIDADQNRTNHRKRVYLIWRWRLPPYRCYFHWTTFSRTTNQKTWYIAIGCISTLTGTNQKPFNQDKRICWLIDNYLFIFVSQEIKCCFCNWHVFPSFSALLSVRSLTCYTHS